MAAGGRLGAQHRSHAPSAMQVVDAEADRTKPPAVLTLSLTLFPTQASAQAFVTDALGSPLEGAEIEFRSEAAAPRGMALAAPPQRVRTDARGRAVALHLRPGLVAYAARAAGHGTARGSFDAGIERSVSIDIRLPPASEVHGIVQTEDGTPVARARVWSGAPDSFDGGWTLSAADGSFRLRGLSPGVVELTACESPDASLAPGVRRARTSLELFAGQTGEWIATLTADTRGIHGEVVDAQGAPCQRWLVKARAGGNSTTTTTGTDGTFRLQMPGPGPVDLFAYHPGKPPTSFANASARGVDPQASPVRLVAEDARRFGSLRARVETHDHRALPATVTCWHHERRETARFRATSEGRVQIDELPPGTIDVHFEHPGQSPARFAQRVTVRQQVNLGTVVLGLAATLSGKVTGPAGEIPQDVHISLQTGEHRLVAEYNAGTYRFSSVPPGRHLLQVQGTDVAAAAFAIDLEAGVEKEQDMHLQAGVPRPFVVRAPAAAGRLVSLAIRRQQQVHTWYGSTSLQAGNKPGDAGVGEFVAYMAPGEYEVVAWGSESWEARRMVRFAAGEGSAVELELEQH
jgi:hypothetical protein